MMKILTSPRNKTLIATIFFSLIGIVSIILTKIDWYVSLPLVLFYALVVLNTYFSMRLFTHLVPSQKLAHHIVDGLLVCLFILLAVCFARPIIFAMVVTLLFAVATIKYVLLINVLDHPRLLKRKITIDVLGKIMGLLTLAGMLAGYTFLSSWILVAVFTVANIFLLFVRPMYKADY